jgi:hypothetical protein
VNRALRLAAALLGALLLLLGGPGGAALAGPVDWQEVPASAEGRQWWDAGSLRVGRSGRLSVLSRFLPAAEDANGRLYVMELDCEQELYRDTSVNGIPHPRAEWQAAAGDALSTATLRAACRAGAPLLDQARHG